MSTMETPNLDELAYAAYGAHLRNSGMELWPWEELLESGRDHWRDVAYAVVATMMGQPPEREVKQ